MECLIGVKGRDFIILASDTTAGRSIMTMKRGKDVFEVVLPTKSYKNIDRHFN